MMEDAKGTSYRRKVAPFITPTSQEGTGLPLQSGYVGLGNKCTEERMGGNSEKPVKQSCK